MAQSTQFTISQAFLGAPLKFQPALGTSFLTQLIDLYIPGPALKQQKLSEVTIDFYNHATVDFSNGSLVKTYHVVLPETDYLPPSISPSSSGFGTGAASPISEHDSQHQRLNAFTTRVDRSRIKKAKKQVKRIEPSVPGFQILTRDGVDVTNCVGRGVKTKEQREHTHLMRTLKACDACKKKKTRCDPSHRQLQLQTHPQAPSTSRSYNSDSISTISTPMSTTFTPQSSLASPLSIDSFSQDLLTQASSSEDLFLQDPATQTPYPLDDFDLFLHFDPTFPSPTSSWAPNLPTTSPYPLINGPASYPALDTIDSTAGYSNAASLKHSRSPIPGSLFNTFSDPLDGVQNVDLQSDSHVLADMIGNYGEAAMSSSSSSSSPSQAKNGFLYLHSPLARSIHLDLSNSHEQDSLPGERGLSMASASLIQSPGAMHIPYAYSSGAMQSPSVHDSGVMGTLHVYEHGTSDVNPVQGAVKMPHARDQAAVGIKHLFDQGATKLPHRPEGKNPAQAPGLIPLAILAIMTILLLLLPSQFLLALPILLTLTSPTHDPKSILMNPTPQPHHHEHASSLDVTPKTPKTGTNMEPSVVPVPISSSPAHALSMQKGRLESRARLRRNTLRPSPR